MFSFSSRCKDSLPQETIRKAQELISDLGLLTSEQWFTPVNGLYSLHLSVIGTSIYSNGKGSSPEFALASAYGELLERMQNLAFYRISRYSDYYAPKTKFRVAQDEVITNGICDLKEQEKYFRMVLETERFDECIHAWEYVYGTSGVTNTRFKNIKNPNDEILIPELVFSVCYGSNGMASGNTYEEAVVQALSEIFERYAVKRIIDERLTPPDVTEKVIKQFPEIGEIIQEVQIQSDDIRIQIKDVSLGLGLPVFAAVYIDTRRNEYFVNLGCHPNVCVAIECCLTELYQGQEKVKISNATSIGEMIEDKALTMNSIFCTGEGAYPLEFFGKKASYPELDLMKMAFGSNADMCNYCINTISVLGYTLYYQDAGFLGFPAVSIVVPGMSEAIYDPSDSTVIRNSEQYVHFLRNYQSVKTMGDDELVSLTQFLESYRHEPSTSVNEILRVPIDPRIKVHFDDITIDLFLAMIYIRLHKYSQAKKHLDTFIKYMRSCNADTDAIRYNLLVSSILRCRINEMDDMAVVDCLSEHFHSDEVMSAIQDIRPETVFDGLPMCSCPNCKPCEYERFCCFSKDNEVANKLLKMKAHYGKIRAF